MHNRYTNAVVKGGSSSSLIRRLEQIWRTAARNGDAWPGEPVLAETLTTSRPALREALIRLEERGYITRRQGADTVVNRALLDIGGRIDEKLDIADIISSAGQRADVELLEFKWDTAHPTEVDEFGLVADQEVLRTKKVWSADGLPVVVACDVIPVRAGAVPKADVDARKPIFDISSVLGNQPPEWEMVKLGIATLADDAKVMQGLVDEPFLSFDVVGVTKTAATAYWASERHRPGALPYAMVRILGRR